MKSNTENRQMFYGAKPDIFEKAKSLRLDMTPAEKLLWQRLSNNQVLGLRFKAQHPIKQFIADFYCHKIRLVIEVDGEVHHSVHAREYDKGREMEMAKLEITTLRFSNDIVINQLDEVIDKIEKECKRLFTPRP